MDSSKLNDWLTLITNVAVVAGIIFLAMEIRQNNILLAQQSRAIGIGQMFDTVERFIENPDLIELVDADPESLSTVELRRRQFMGIRTLAAWEYQWGEWRRGLVDDFEWQTNGYRSAFHGEDAFGSYIRDAWSLYKEVRAAPEFAEWMEEHVVDD